MEPQDPLEVLFCDLCNTSVPLQDFDAGTATRLNGKAIGACCLATLRGTGSARPSAGEGAAGAPGARPAGHDSRILPLGIAVLAAVAAATLFLEFRIDQAETRWLHGNDQVAASVQSQAEVVQGISVALDGVVRRTDFDQLEQRLAAINATQQRMADTVQALDKAHTLSAEATQKALAVLQEAERLRPDLGPGLADLRQQLQHQAVSLAQLLAQPRPREVVPAAVSEPPVVIPGLAPELVHQVAKLKDADAATRFEAVDELLRSKDAQVLEHLLPMAKDADLFVRRLTVEGLKDFHKPAVVDVLIVALADPEDIVRDTAWRSLKDLTGQKLPFEASGSRDARLRAQQKWQEWWDKNRDTFGA